MFSIKTPEGGCSPVSSFGICNFVTCSDVWEFWVFEDFKDFKMRQIFLQLSHFISLPNEPPFRIDEFRCLARTSLILSHSVNRRKKDRLMTFGVQTTQSCGIYLKWPFLKTGNCLLLSFVMIALSLASFFSSLFLARRNDSLKFRFNVFGWTLKSFFNRIKCWRIKLRSSMMITFVVLMRFN